METKGKDPDKIELKEKKGVWKRFVKLFPKCNLPWVWLIVYIILEFGLVNIGLSETDYTAQLFAGDTSAKTIFTLIAVIIINLVGSNILIFTRLVTSAKINRNMRTVVFSKVLRLPMSYFKDENPRDAVYRITNNSIMIDSTIMLVIIPLATALFTSGATLVRVFNYDWRLSVILLAFVPVQLFVAFIFGRINFSLSQKEAKLNSGLVQKLAELITNIPLAKAFAKEKKEAASGEEIVNRLYKIKIKSSWIDQIKELSNTVISLIQAAIIVLVGVLLLNNEEITRRAWVAFFMFSSVFSGAVTEVLMYWNNMKIIQGGADKVAEIMDAIEEPKDGETVSDLKGDIEVQDLTFGYDEEKPVLKNVNAFFKDNCTTALLGVSGCGKTTLINLIMRLYSPSQGRIVIDGRDISDLSLASFRDQFVMVSQSSMLFSGTIRENICYGNGEVSEEALKKALESSGAAEFVNSLPNGLDTVLEEYGQNLSGGQKQKLALSRALLSDAHYLIFDEPAASMDAISTAELMSILKEISKDKCMIVIAHTSAVLSIASRVVVIENGTVSDQGDKEDVIKTNRFLAEFAGKEVRND